MRKLLTVILSLAVLTALTGFNQPSGKLLQGKVISFSESFPLEGVIVRVKGTKTISGTQPDGIYSIEVQPADKVLEFSLQGYQSQEVNILPSQSEYDVILRSL